MRSLNSILAATVLSAGMLVLGQTQRPPAESPYNSLDGVILQYERNDAARNHLLLMDLQGAHRCVSITLPDTRDGREAYKVLGWELESAKENQSIIEIDISHTNSSNCYTPRALRIKADQFVGNREYWENEVKRCEDWVARSVHNKTPSLEALSHAQDQLKRAQSKAPLSEGGIIYEWRAR
jgi:hypothetical protein